MPLTLCGGGRTDGEVGKDLSRVGVNDGDTESPGNGQVELCFSHGGGTYEHDESLHTLLFGG